MYKVLPNKNSNKKKEPYYKITFEYMIGDADGHTSEETTYLEKEFTEEVQKALHILQKFSSLSIKGHWGMMFDTEHLSQALKENKISNEEYEILRKEIDDDWTTEGYFCGCIKAETEYSFLVIESIRIEYFDEYGIRHNVMWED